jgi:hypothetical protein
MKLNHSSWKREHLSISEEERTLIVIELFKIKSENPQLRAFFSKAPFWISFKGILLYLLLYVNINLFARTYVFSSDHSSYASVLLLIFSISLLSLTFYIIAYTFYSAYVNFKQNCISLRAS